MARPPRAPRRRALAPRAASQIDRYREWPSPWFFLNVSSGAGNGSTPGAGAVIFLTPLGLSADVRLRTMTDPPGVQPPGMVRGPQDHEMANEIDAGGCTDRA